MMHEAKHVKIRYVHTPPPPTRSTTLCLPLSVGRGAGCERPGLRRVPWARGRMTTILTVFKEKNAVVIVVVVVDLT